MASKKVMKKTGSILLALILILTNVPPVGAAGLDPAGYRLLDGTDFEDGGTFGFVPGGGASAEIADESGNKYLSVGGAGNGGRSIVKTLDEPTDEAEVLLTFDWKPGEVTTGANSSEIALMDTYGYPIFRLAKEGGSNGRLLYGAGSSGTDLSGLQTVTDVTYTDAWLSVSIHLDFDAEKIGLEIKERDDAARSFVQTDIDLSRTLYNNRIGTIAINGNRASGQSLNFTAGLDNFYLYGSGERAPVQTPRQVAAIETVYAPSIQLPRGTSLEDVIGSLPATVDVRLDNGAVVRGIEVNWSSEDYDPDTVGAYTFIGTLSIDGIPNLANHLNVGATVDAEIVESSALPVIPGYTTAAYSDFGDTVAVVPAYWGFVTANATLNIHDGDVGGNRTSKLEFTQIDQSGGRVATKNLDLPVKGVEILAKFDWYPGELNDKGSNANENGGEIRILDDSNNILFTLNNTRNSPLRYFAGGRTELAQDTGFTNPNAWYTVEIHLDLLHNVIELDIAEQASGDAESYTVPLDNVNFDGSIGSIRIVGNRTSGNNITWTTYLDNFGIYYVPIPDDTIVTVDKLPYHRVYVNETTESIESIGLPEHVTVTLADNSKALVAVAEWTAVGKPWNPAESGVYAFNGVLAESAGVVNTFGRTATVYVYNRLAPPQMARQTEWLDRGVIALRSDGGIFVSWRLLAHEYADDVKFNLYRNEEKLNGAPLFVTNFADAGGMPGDTYRVETIVNGTAASSDEATAQEFDYLAIPMQKPEGGTTATGDYTYSVNDGSVGDLDGDGEYEVIVKWYPSNAIDSAQEGMTGPTIFDAYKLDGTLLWRINMGLNLTSGAHYHQFIVADLDGDGKSEFLIKTADATTVYGTTDGMYDSSKVIGVIGNPEDDGRWINERGHVFDGPEYMSVFNGETGEVIDTIDYAFPLGDVASWGDTWHNRSDRFLAGLAYLDGKKPSAIYGRGYYERTTFVAYSLVDGKLVEEWTFDSAEEGRGGGLGFHSLATGDVDNDGYDEIIAGSLVLDQDGSILYAMDGEMGREMGSHGDALHVGAFDPAREGLHVVAVHEVPAVASLEYHDGATGETLMSFYASKDAGRGLAANITSAPGYEFWGTAGDTPETGGGIYNVQGHVVADSFRDAGLSVNFALYWDGDLLHELLDHTHIAKYNADTGVSEVLRNFEGVVSNNGTKATPTLQADIIGDWREEVLLPTTDSSELRIYSTTIPTEYRLYTLMHDTVYRMGIAWQNTAYNQPPHIGFYLGEDIRAEVLAGELIAPDVEYTNAPDVVPPEPPEGPEEPGGGRTARPGSGSGASTPAGSDLSVRADGTVVIRPNMDWNADERLLEVKIGEELIDKALAAAKAGEQGYKALVVELEQEAAQWSIQLPPNAVRSSDSHRLVIAGSLGNIVLPSDMLSHLDLQEDDTIELVVAGAEPSADSDRKVLEISLLVNGEKTAWHNTDASVTISIPYELDGTERSLYELFSIVHIDDEGNRTPIYNGRYHLEEGAMVFTTNHFSQFAVSYAPKTFIDIGSYSWAQREIAVLAAKGIIQGTSEVEETFGPATNISRADFILLLVKTLGLHAEVDDNFSDVRAGDYYYEAVGIAKKLGISNGDGNGLFNPLEAISRQDMFTLTARALDISGHNLGEAGLEMLDGFADREDIANYALQTIAALVDSDLVLGSDNRINPLGNTSRAEAAVFLYRIYSM